MRGLNWGDGRCCSIARTVGGRSGRRRTGRIHKRRSRLMESMYPTKAFQSSERKEGGFVQGGIDHYLVECGGAFILEDLGSTV